ncbi:MAG: nicotinamide-nucleotide amidohydrolase family protein, partial [Actinomycetota bacterium]
TSAPGASRYFAGGVVAYSHEAKRDLLGVSKDTLEEHGAVSEASALEMARGAAERFGADIGISTTGVAGPDEIEGEERGRVWVGLAAGNTEEARTFVAPGDRDQVRAWAEQGALELLRRHLLGSSTKTSAPGPI